MSGSNAPVVLESGPARAVFDLDNGARLASLLVDGRELLVGRDGDGLRWGCYPMVPWAGRIRNGRFSFGGVDHRLPINLPPHAIHGTGFTSAWERRGEAMVLELSDPWPYPGRVEQRAELTADGLAIELRVIAVGGPMPAMAGWHPWFRRRLDGVEVELLVDAGAMFELDDEMIPTGRLVDPAPPPWDNTFTDLSRGPTLRWPGSMELELSSNCPCWTIYTQPEHAVCVEPQTAAPDIFNRHPEHGQPELGEPELGGPGCVAVPGEPLVATFDLRWASSC